MDTFEDTQNNSEDDYLGIRRELAKYFDCNGKGEHVRGADNEQLSSNGHGENGNDDSHDEDLDDYGEGELLGGVEINTSTQAVELEAEDERHSYGEATSPKLLHVEREDSDELSPQEDDQDPPPGEVAGFSLQEQIPSGTTEPQTPREDMDYSVKQAGTPEVRSCDVSSDEEGCEEGGSSTYAGTNLQEEIETNGENETEEIRKAPDEELEEEASENEGEGTTEWKLDETQTGTEIKAEKEEDKDVAGSGEEEEQEEDDEKGEETEEEEEEGEDDGEEDEEEGAMRREEKREEHEQGINKEDGPGGQEQTEDASKAGAAGASTTEDEEEEEEEAGEAEEEKDEIAQDEDVDVKEEEGKEEEEEEDKVEGEGEEGEEDEEEEEGEEEDEEEEEGEEEEPEDGIRKEEEKGSSNMRTETADDSHLRRTTDWLPKDKVVSGLRRQFFHSDTTSSMSSMHVNAPSPQASDVTDSSSDESDARREAYSPKSELEDVSPPETTPSSSAGAEDWTHDDWTGQVIAIKCTGKLFNGGKAAGHIPSVYVSRQYNHDDEGTVPSDQSNADVIVKDTGDVTTVEKDVVEDTRPVGEVLRHDDETARPIGEVPRHDDKTARPVGEVPRHDGKTVRPVGEGPRHDGEVAFPTGDVSTDASQPGRVRELGKLFDRGAPVFPKSMNFKSSSETGGGSPMSVRKYRALFETDRAAASTSHNGKERKDEVSNPPTGTVQSLRGMFENPKRNS